MAEVTEGAMPNALRDVIEEYLALVRSFPLEHLRDDAHYDEALAVMWPLVENPNRTAAQEAYLGALTDLVEAYDNAHVEFPPRTGVDALRFLMEQSDLKQEDLAPIFGTQSIVSDVLNGKRNMTMKHIERLAERFHVSPAVFFDDPGATQHQ